MRSRKISFVAGLAVLGLLAGACSEDSSSESTSAPATEAPTSEAPSTDAPSESPLDQSTLDTALAYTGGTGTIGGLRERRGATFLVHVTDVDRVTAGRTGGAAGVGERGVERRLGNRSLTRCFGTGRL